MPYIFVPIPKIGTDLSVLLYLNRNSSLACLVAVVENDLEIKHNNNYKREGER